MHPQTDEDPLEDYLKTTPTIPDQVFEALPNIIREGARAFTDKRKRDVFRLLLVALIEPFVHHPMVVRWGIQGNMDFLKGKKSWGEMTRTGFTKKEQK